MTTIPADIKYTESHEWIKVEADGVFSVGITSHAQEALGDIVFLELPEIGRQVVAGEAVAVVESVKAASDIYAPVSGEIVATNREKLSEAPESVNAAPYDNWLFKIRANETAPQDRLMDAQAYRLAIGE